MSTVSGRVVALGDRRPQLLLRVELAGDTTRVGATDEDGTFRFEDVSPGDYRIVVRAFAFNPVERALAVPARSALDVDIELAAAVDRNACEYAMRMAEPALELSRPESLVVRRTLGPGVELRQTIVIASADDELRVRVRVVNIGRAHATITDGCAPWVTAAVLVHPRSGGASVMCAPTPRTLAPGDSVVLEATGPLRGSPGRHRVEVRAVHPEVFHATMELEFVPARASTNRAVHAEFASARPAGPTTRMSSHVIQCASMAVAPSRE